MNDLEAIITSRFPEELTEVLDFEDFYDQHLDLVRGPALALVERLRTELAEAEKDLAEAEQVARDRWWLFGGELPIKSAASARSKLARTIEEQEGEAATTGPRLSVEELRSLLEGFSDRFGSSGLGGREIRCSRTIRSKSPPSGSTS